MKATWDGLQCEGGVVESAPFRLEHVGYSVVSVVARLECLVSIMTGLAHTRMSFLFALHFGSSVQSFERSFMMQERTA